ncbi:MAG: cation-transporting P-type ATPase, partial [Promethearchaeota archaeon]
MIEAHDKSIEELYQILNTNEEGLSSPEAEQQLETYGKNELTTGKKVNPLIIFFNQF